jgi:hypothetical protein
MGLLTILAAPVAPVRLVVALGRLLQRQADEQRYSSIGLRRRLEALDAARDSGELSDEEYAETQQSIVQELIVRSEPAGLRAPEQAAPGQAAPGQE